MATIPEIKDEIQRLTAKLSASSDPDIREALSYRLKALTTQLEQLKAQEVKESKPPEVIQQIEPLAGEELEKQIRFAHAHLTGSRLDQAKSIVDLLEKSNPNDAQVLLLSADLKIAKKDLKGAQEVLKLARKLYPQSVEIDRKLGEVALSQVKTGSLEDQLRAAESDIFIGDGDIAATATWATVISMILPGAGHIAIGKTVKGGIYMVSWMVIVGFLLWEGSLFKGFAKFMAAREANIPMIALMGGFLALGIHLVAIFECAALAKGNSGRRQIEKPKPPVDLPFE